MYKKISMVKYDSPEVIDIYAKYRPTYPRTLHSCTIEWLSNEPSTREEGGHKFKLAIDIGCGAGISTPWLCEYFEEVIGVDLNENQLAAARKGVQTLHNNLTFRVGVAEDLSFQMDNSVDLITVGAALHWFDVDTFCREALRVLRPGGALAAYTFNFGRITLTTGQRFDILEEVFPTLQSQEGKSVVDIVRKYRDLHVTVLKHFPQSECKDFQTEMLYNMDGLRGYIRSISAFLNPETHPDRLEVLCDKIMEIYHNDPPEKAIHFECDVLAILARKD